MLNIYGITTIIGLISAPYIDQTFWQRSFSIKNNKLVSTYTLAALLFMLIPICFGILGLFNSHISSTLDITQFNTITIVVISLTILLALIATIDSNYCAIASLFPNIPNVSILSLCIISILVVNLTNLSILEMFLIYGTIRTSMCIPTILIIFSKYNENRLYYVTLVTCILCSILYILGTLYKIQYIWIVTMLAFIVPVIGYSNSNFNFNFNKNKKGNIL